MLWILWWCQRLLLTPGMGTLEVTSGVDSFPAAKGHKPEQGAKVDGKDGHSISHRVLAAPLTKDVPITFGSKRREGGRKSTLSKPQLYGKCSVMFPTHKMPSLAMSHSCALGIFLTFLRYEARGSERWIISLKGTQWPMGSRDWVTGVADSNVPGLLRTWCTNGNKRISPSTVHSPFPSSSFTSRSFSRLLHRAVAKCLFGFRKRTPKLPSHWKQLNN